ncbi:MAG: intradiol ring-cleavage dioxygenase [Gammaproteobacteria bacterium]|nr:MAG: intradiol ring-cleavage dioxygenase [Gammaproteobacteria bacterium]
MKLATTGREKGLQPPNPERRRWLTHIGGIAVVGLLPTVTQGAVPLRPTPMQSAGPFYPETLPADSDNDLVKVHGQEDYAGGEMTELRGQVVDIAGHPVIGARIEIWQCDANGRYHHPRDRGHAPRDDRFQGYGRHVADLDGRFRFRTIRPVPYPGRTPHIHFAVHGAGIERPLVTQMYIAGHELNGDDFLLQRVPASLRELLLVPFVPVADGPVRWQAEFRVVVDAAGRFT